MCFYPSHFMSIDALINGTISMSFVAYLQSLGAGNKQTMRAGLRELLTEIQVSCSFGFEK